MSADFLPVVERAFRDSVTQTLQTYITIPNLSPMFDKNWAAAGHMDRAVTLLADWVRAQDVPGLRMEVMTLPGRTPLIFMEVDGDARDTVLLYGHLDKQPPFDGWEEGLGAFKPVLRGDKLYGRGGADDGYATFCSVLAIQLLKARGIRHARCVVMIEAGEESGSPDLPAYMDALKDRIGQPSLVVCLDSGCGNYDQLWATTSLRGLIGGELSVSLLREGVHSGDGSGVVASSFRVMRMLLSRVEDETSGAVKLPELNVEIPQQRRGQADRAAAVLGSGVWQKLPVHAGVRPMADNDTQAILNRTWRPALSVTGASGLPALEMAGNVLRPQTTVKLSMRVPPTSDVNKAAQALKRALEEDPPYGAKVSFKLEKASTGWNAPALAGWLEKAMDDASSTWFGKPACMMGEGGSIPFMGMLGERYPQAQFLITGVLGPGSNAHGPNEFLHLPTAQKLTASVAHVLAEHARR